MYGSNIFVSGAQVSKIDEVSGEFYMLDWTREVDTNEAYIAALDLVITFYNSNSNFRIDVARSTAKVLGKDSTSSEDSESGKRSLESVVSVSFLFSFSFFNFLCYLNATNQNQC